MQGICVYPIVGIDRNPCMGLSGTLAWALRETHAWVSFVRLVGLF
mgnify:CR=1 FL=1